MIQWHIKSYDTNNMHALQNKYNYIKSLLTARASTTDMIFLPWD